MDKTHTMKQILDAARSEAFAYGRCCDQYQDGFGTFHCHNCGQRTFAMLRGVQAILGVDSEHAMTHEQATSAALIRRAAPKLLEACEQIVWKLGHNTGDGPASIDRRDATVLMAVAAIAAAKGE